MSTNHLIIISIDGLNAMDIPSMKKMSYLGAFIQQGSYAKEAIGVYPSLTYPSHVSIITGTLPNKHRIYDNRPFNPDTGSKSWFFYDKDIAVQTLYGAAIDKGLITGNFFWPVTAGAKIKYNCPPIWPTYDKESQIALSLKYGNPLFLLDIEKKFGWMRNGRQYPQIDNFTAVAGAYTLKKKRPNLMLVAFSELDHQRHIHGVHSQEAIASLLRTNEHIGLLVETVRDIGAIDNTTFVVLGDHGFTDFRYNIALNALFVERGYMKLNYMNQVCDWRMYAHNAGGSAQIYLSENCENLYQEAYSLLHEFMEDGRYGISQVFNSYEVRAKGVQGAFSFVVEALPGFHFGSELTGEVIIDIFNIADNKHIYEVATHGHDPLLSDYRTTAIFSGAGIKSGEVLEQIHLIDIAPTLAKLIKVKLPEAEGKILTSILK